VLRVLEDDEKVDLIDEPLREMDGVRDIRGGMDNLDGRRFLQNVFQLISRRFGKIA
jgi:hypothetical protein